MACGTVPYNVPLCAMPRHSNDSGEPSLGQGRTIRAVVQNYREATQGPGVEPNKCIPSCVGVFSKS